MGRKPLHEEPMTATERTRRYRARKKAEGAKELHFTLAGDSARQLEALVEFFELPQAQMLFDLLNIPLARATKTMEMYKSDPERYFSKYAESEEQLKAGKRKLWKILCFETFKMKGGVLQ